MKNGKILLAIGTAIMVTMLPSCDFYKKVADAVNKPVASLKSSLKSSGSKDKKNLAEKVEKKGVEVKETTTVTKAELKAEAVKEEVKNQPETPEITYQPEVGGESGLPTDREDFSDAAEERTYTSQQLAKGIIKGDWAIEKVNGKAVVGEETPFLRFVPGENMVYGNNGCNVINGAFQYNVADSTLTFSNLASTMRLCNMEGLTDYEINAALDMTRYYELKIEGDDYYMYLLDGYRKPVMSLMHQNFEFLNGSWSVKAINGNDVDEPDMSLVIDVDEGKVHGNTGCNILNGNLEVDMDKANSISFSKLLTTRMACPPESHQTAFLVALEEACCAKPLSKTSVVLLNSQGDEVLRLVRPEK